MTPSRTLLAANCMIFAMVVPNDFSPPIASTGMAACPWPGIAVVAGVLVEGGELHEAGMHRARHRVELGIVRARRFAEARRGRGKLVPEAIEIDALAACHQPLHVRPAEAEVPEQRVLEDLLPRPDAWHRRIDQDEARDSLGILRGKGIADHVADIVRDEVGSVDLQCIEHAGHVAGLRLLVEASGGLAERPMPRRSGTTTV